MKLFRNGFSLSSWSLICAFTVLVACSADEGPTSDAGARSTDAAADAAADISHGEDITGDEDTEVYCTTSSPCCGDDGNVSTYVRCEEACPVDTSYDQCTEEARCADSSVPKPVCVGAEGEQVEAVCESHGERDLWGCPQGSTTSTGGADAG